MSTPPKLTMQERIDGGKKAYQTFVSEMQAQPDYEQNKQAAKDEIEKDLAKGRVSDFETFMAEKMQNPEFAEAVNQKQAELDLYLKEDKESLMLGQVKNLLNYLLMNGRTEFLQIYQTVSLMSLNKPLRGVISRI